MNFRKLLGSHHSKNPLQVFLSMYAFVLCFPRYVMNIFKSAIENYKCKDGQSLEKHADCTILY